jgi:hypothetical protein
MTIQIVKVNSKRKKDLILDALAREGRRGSYDEFWTLDGERFSCIKKYFLIYYRVRN